MRDPGIDASQGREALANPVELAPPLWFFAASVSHPGILWLWRSGRTQWAGRVVFLTALALAAALATSGGVGGFDAVGIALLSVLAIAANALLARREALIGMGGVLALSASVLGVEAYGGWGTDGSLRAGLFRSASLLALVGVSSVVSRSLADASSRLADRVREYETALGLANDCLRGEAGRREALIAELEARNGELERFCYTVSHDLKSPLVTIGGFLGYVERNAVHGDLDSLRRDLDRIGRAHRKMLRLLDELLDLSRAGRHLRAFEEVPFGEIVEEARELCEGVLAQRKVRLSVAPDLPIVHGDRHRMVQVVQNLLDNAVKYSDGDAPVIEIGARQDALKQVLFVRDRGIGIDAAFHERVFQLFEKLDPEATGSGVGLALVKRIVEAHGGRVWVESDGIGTGSTFCFTLPRPPGSRVEAPAGRSPRDSSRPNPSESQGSTGRGFAPE